MNWLCFTDHVDLNENDYGCGYYSHEVFFENLRQLRKSESSIKICAGIEFSEPHLYAKQLEELLLQEVVYENRKRILVADE